MSEEHSYFSHALSLAALHGPGPWPDGGAPLPDDQPRERGKLSFAPGALDGIISHHGRTSDVGETVAELADLVAAPERWPLLRDRLADVSTMDIADPLSAALTERGQTSDEVRAVGIWLVEHGTRRGAVAGGLVLLGLAGDARDRDLLLLLGGLEELTLYAAVALRRSQPDPEEALFELARRVDGWGRIHVVERLEGTQDPRIRAWLLRDGFRNTVMYEYLAHLAATTGVLHEALLSSDVDDALLDGAGDILIALINGGPAKAMEDYPDGPAVVDRYLTLLGQRPAVLKRIATAAWLRSSLPEGAPYWGWSAETTARLTAAVDALAARPDWHGAIDAGLADPDPAVYRVACDIAMRLDPAATRDRVTARLRETPEDHHLWFTLLRGAPMAAVVALAEEVLPLDELAGGPTDEMGLGLNGPGGVLDLVVSRLDEHPGLGWPLIRAGLANATVRNRNLAVNALAAWPSTALPRTRSTPCGPPSTANPMPPCAPGC
jgi:hypothetical protein